MVDKTEAHQRMAIYYREFVEKHSTEITALDYELLQIQQVLDWLSGRVENHLSVILLSLVENISSYFERQSLNNLILKYVNVCLEAAERLEQNPRWVYLIGYRANWALGRWEDAGKYILLALKTTQPNSPEYATVLQSLGSYQLNRGNYQDALRTFINAKRIYRDIGDAKGEISILTEEAAYYLNKAENPVAYRLYSEIFDFELNHEGQISDHTLLMMGVVSRRLKNYSNAINYLDQLLQRAKINHLRSVYATAAHHLAWTYLDQGQYEQAKEYGEQAKTIYDEFDDLRGSSDADEQLGLIALAMRKYDESQTLLERSITTRKILGNQQGYASSVRRLAKLRFAQGRPFAATYYLAKSMYLYQKIGMLPLPRILRFVHDVFNKQLMP
jgi:tetratricopeptide (TPR) repeat protein